MVISGTLSRDGNYWVAEIPLLGAVASGDSPDAALRATESSVRQMAEEHYEWKDFVVTVSGEGENQIALRSDDPEKLVALVLKRRRLEMNLTLVQAAQLIGSKYANSYAAYEQGRRMPTVVQFEKLLKAMDPSLELTWGMTAAGTAGAERKAA